MIGREKEKKRQRQRGREGKIYKIIYLSNSIILCQPDGTYSHYKQRLKARN